MPRMLRCLNSILPVVALAAGASACIHHQSSGQPLNASAGADRGDRQLPLVLAENEGEHRVRRIGGVARFSIKVDPVTAQSRELVMVAESVAPNERIPAHMHPSEDEIIFVHAGTGAVELGNRRATVASGSTVFIPRATRISLRNTGDTPLEIVAVFSHPGFEEYLRDTSIPEGQSVVPLSPVELASIRQKHAAHVIWERR